jgi:hypothetical protein
MNHFTKKPITISAIQWTGDNLREVIAFTDGPPDTRTTHASMAWDDYAELVKRDGLKIFTLEGKMSAAIGDWIIKGVKGEHYPCKPDIFAATYEAATSALPVVDHGPDSLERIVAKRDDERAEKTGAALAEHDAVTGLALRGLRAMADDVRWEPGQAPRVTQEMVDAQIVDETYTVLPSGRVTVCELTLQNGFTVRGESAVVFIENNVPEKGRQIARQKAVDQIWPLLGFRLRDELARSGEPAAVQ